jgi:hypothetical protein
VLLLVVAVLGGLVAGRLRAPAGARAVRLQLRQLPLLAVGAFGTALAQVLDGGLATLALAGALAVLLAFVAANAHITGVLVLGCGLLLNLVAVVLNNGMPVRGEALVVAGVVEEAELPTTTFTGPRHLETGSDRLAVLGDVLPVPITREVLSFGDLIILAGAADAVRELSRRRRRSWPSAERRDYRSTQSQLSIVEAWGEHPDHIDLTTAPAPTPVPARPLVAASSSSPQA